MFDRIVYPPYIYLRGVSISQIIEKILLEGVEHRVQMLSQA